MADGFLAHRQQAAGAEKLADLELGVRAADGSRLAGLDAAVQVQVPYKPDADPSAARSSAGQEPADAAVEPEQSDAQFAQPAPKAHLQSGLDLPVCSLQSEQQPVELPAHWEPRVAT